MKKNDFVRNTSKSMVNVFMTTRKKIENLYQKVIIIEKCLLDTENLHGKMWFKERKGQKISFSHVGDDEMLQDDFYLSLRLDKWEQVALVGKESRLKVAVQLIPKYMKILIWIMQEVTESDGEREKISKNRFELSRCINS